MGRECRGETLYGHTFKCLQLMDMSCVCVSNGLCMQGVSTLFAGLCRACMLVFLCVGM